MHSFLYYYSVPFHLSNKESIAVHLFLIHLKGCLILVRVVHSTEQVPKKKPSHYVWIVRLFNIPKKWMDVKVVLRIAFSN